MSNHTKERYGTILFYAVRAMEGLLHLVKLAATKLWARYKPSVIVLAWMNKLVFPLLLSGSIAVGIHVFEKISLFGVFALLIFTFIGTMAPDLDGKGIAGVKGSYFILSLVAVLAGLATLNYGYIPALVIGFIALYLTIIFAKKAALSGNHKTFIGALAVISMFTGLIVSISPIAYSHVALVFLSFGIGYVAQIKNIRFGRLDDLCLWIMVVGIIFIFFDPIYGFFGEVLERALGDSHGSINRNSVPVRF